MRRRTVLQKIRQRCKSDRGYAVIMTALVLVPLMGFAGFAVDVGAWYARASSLQRAADAAALAGVVWQPDFTEAESAARAEAARNGFIHGVDGVEVNVTDTGTNQLEVQIVDTDADMYFAGLFIDNVSIGRQAVSEYVLSVPLGSPENRFGTGTDDFGGTATATNFWAAVNGYCSGKEQGDPLSSGFIGTGWADCATPDPSWTVNTEQDPLGYWYAIDKPDGLSADINVQVNYASMCNSSPDLFVTSAGTFSTVFTLHSADNTPLDDFDNPVVATWTAAEAASCADLWTTMFTIPAAGQAGRWYLNVRAPAGDFAAGVNSYALFASVAGSTTPCSTLVTSSCPALYAIGSMGIYVRDAANPANFYLAEIGPQHAGKQLLVSMWDPAEGMDNLRIRDPSGTAVPFTWSSIDELNPADSTSGSSISCGGEPCLDVAGNNFNANRVNILVDIPLTTFGNNWWTVSYYKGSGAVTDRTTWTVEVLGDPVRLLE